MPRPAGRQAPLRAATAPGAVNTRAPASPCAWCGRNLADLSFEELGNIRITSVSRRAERLSEAPASVYVVSSDDNKLLVLIDGRTVYAPFFSGVLWDQ